MNSCNWVQPFSSACLLSLSTAPRASAPAPYVFFYFQAGASSTAPSCHLPPFHNTIPVPASSPTDLRRAQAGACPPVLLCLFHLLPAALATLLFLFTRARSSDDHVEGQGERENVRTRSPLRTPCHPAYSCALIRRSSCHLPRGPMTRQKPRRAPSLLPNFVHVCM